MRVLPRLDQRCFAWLLLVMLFLPAAVWAEFEIVDIQGRLSKNSLKIGGKIDYVLTDKVEEALGKGIPLNIVIDIYLNSERAIIWDKNVSRWQLLNIIRYHALSGQYLITTETPDEGNSQAESFTSLQEALEYMGTIDLAELSIPPELLQGDNNYRIEFRTYLDIATLPAPLRPVAYTSPAWHLNTGWTTWAVLR